MRKAGQEHGKRGPRRDFVSSSRHLWALGKDGTSPNPTHWVLRQFGNRIWENETWHQAIVFLPLRHGRTCACEGDQEAAWRTEVGPRMAAKQPAQAEGKGEQQAEREGAGEGESAFSCGTHAAFAERQWPAKSCLRLPETLSSGPTTPSPPPQPRPSEAPHFRICLAAYCSSTPWTAPRALSQASPSLLRRRIRS